MCTGQRLQFLGGVYRTEGKVSGWCVQDREHSFWVVCTGQRVQFCGWCVQDRGYSLWLMCTGERVQFVDGVYRT